MRRQIIAALTRTYIFRFLPFSEVVSRFRLRAASDNLALCLSPSCHLELRQRRPSLSFLPSLIFFFSGERGYNIESGEEGWTWTGGEEEVEVGGLAVSAAGRQEQER